MAKTGMNGISIEYFLSSLFSRMKVESLLLQADWGVSQTAILEGRFNNWSLINGNSETWESNAQVSQECGGKGK